MFMKNHYILKYNDSFINNNIDLTNTKPNSWETIKTNMLSSLSLEGSRFILGAGVRPDIINLFIGPPNFSSDIHIDSTKQSYAINYIWGDSVSKMRWFELLHDVPKPALTTSGSGYLAYTIDQVNLIEEIEVPKNTLMLVRTDIPHQVINYSNNKRYCLSVRGNPTLQWRDAVDYFKAYILEES